VTGRNVRATVSKYARIWLCAADGSAGFLFGGAALWLALADASPAALGVFSAAVWLWLAATAIVGVWLLLPPHAQHESRRAPARPGTPRWPCTSVALAALAAVCAVLFAYGMTATATVVEILFLMRLNLARSDSDASHPGCRRKPGENRWWSYRFEYPLLLAGGVWVALGTPPGWAEAAIVTGLWILAILALIGAAMEHASTVLVDLVQPDLDRRFRARFPDDGPSGQQRVYPPEPRPHWLHRAMKWPMRTGVLVAAWALWTAGLQALAIVLVVATLSSIAWNVRERRTRYGPAVRVDPVGRLVHGVLRLPLIGAGLLLIVAMGVTVMIVLMPPILLSPLLERCIPWSREKRARDKRLANRAEGPKLCRAFNRPQGFIYFLYAAPHQYEHFMAEDSVLTLSGLPVIARDWKQDVTPLKKELGSRAFQNTPEGILLRYAGARSARDGVPLAVIVAPVGMPAVCRFACPYRARAAEPQRLEGAERNFAIAMTHMLKQRRFKRLA
jgi:hypothetical protein